MPLFEQGESHDLKRSHSEDEIVCLKVNLMMHFFTSFFNLYIFALSKMLDSISYHLVGHYIKAFSDHTPTDHAAEFHEIRHGSGTVFKSTYYTYLQRARYFITLHSKSSFSERPRGYIIVVFLTRI